ncbi:glycosyltransferase family 4 protein [Arthrobacter sp. NPDC080031]|uniref:glycosyltransferase family 4 protein n=1 Tax=Arthrobacter sp. NPDC080031 TaxID=3155918 RepID=UPI00344E0F7D
MTKQFDETTPVVLMFHARYRTLGGEERSFDEEASLLEVIGFRVERFELSNTDLRSNFLSAIGSIFNPIVFIKALRKMRRSNPKFVYVNNLWPALSPAVLWAARICNIPTLQALRNYRIVCPSGKLTNEGNCLNCGAFTFPFKCIARGCYNHSRIQTALVSLFSWNVRISNARRRNHAYLATSATTRDLLVRHGISSDRIRIRHNFLASFVEPSFDIGSGVIYVGRLSEEKGIAEIISSWIEIKDAPLLTLVGDGPLADIARRASNDEASNIRWLGIQPASAVLNLLKASSLSIVPSQWAEPFGRAAIESMSVGTPVIHTNGGALTEIVGDTGILLNDLTSPSVSRALGVIEDHLQLTELRRRAFERYYASYSRIAATEDIRQHIEAVVEN